MLEGVEPDNTHSLEELTADLNNGHVETLLIILGQNPVYNAPASLGFLKRLSGKRGWLSGSGSFSTRPRAGATGTFQRRITWRLGRIAALSMERSRMQQPLIEPLYDGKSAHEILSILLGKPDQNSHEIVKEFWQSQYKGADFDTWWKISLHNGWVDGTAIGTVNARESPATAAARSRADAALEVVFRPDPTIWRRHVLEQRLAAGIAQAADEDDLGQHGLHQSRETRANEGRRTATCCA